MAETKRADLSGRKLMPKAASLGVSVFLSDMSGCSIITMARNALVNEFLKTDATD
jgi:hypothetical protein